MPTTSNPLKYGISVEKLVTSATQPQDEAIRQLVKHAFKIDAIKEAVDLKTAHCNYQTQAPKIEADSTNAQHKANEENLHQQKLAEEEMAARA